MVLTSEGILYNWIKFLLALKPLKIEIFRNVIFLLRIKSLIEWQVKK